MKTSATPPASLRTAQQIADDPKRCRVLQAAVSAFQDLGAGASTLEIATRAKVSKRELYALFANKRDLFAACIAERTNRMRFSLEFSAALDSAKLAEVLVAFGAAVLRAVSDPSTLAIFRLAIAESENSPDIARALDAAGREANRRALVEFLRKARKQGLLRAANLDTLAALFFGVLWGDLLIQLLLRVADPPSPKEVERRARAASQAVLNVGGYPEQA